MSLQLRIAAVVTLLFAVAAFLPEKTSAQEIDFGKLDEFESFASGCCASSAVRRLPALPRRGINVNQADFEDFIFRNVDISDFKAELITERDLESLLVSVEVRRGVDPAAAAKRLKSAVHDRFELTPRIVVVETGTLAKEFEASAKMPRFVDRRQ